MNRYTIIISVIALVVIAVIFGNVSCTSSSAPSPSPYSLGSSSSSFPSYSASGSATAISQKESNQSKLKSKQRATYTSSKRPKATVIPTPSPIPTSTPRPKTDSMSFTNQKDKETPVVRPTKQPKSPTQPKIFPTASLKNLSTLATITYVTDADTFKVQFSNGQSDDVRLLGVDGPELPNFSSTNKPGEFGGIINESCLDKWALKGHSFAIESLYNQSVNLILDETAGTRGTYGRLLAYVEVNGIDFGQLLVEKGYARVYAQTEYPSKRGIDYQPWQDWAKENEIGLWSCINEPIPEPDLPPVFPEASISADAAGYYIGQWATVCGKVVDSNYARSSNGSPTFLNFDRPYPTHPFTVVIWRDRRSNFPANPENYYLNEYLCATGKIESYKRKPQIVVENQNQLTIYN